MAHCLVLINVNVLSSNIFFCSSFSAVMLIHSNPLCVTQNWNMNLAYLPLRKWLHQQFRLHGNRFLLISSSGSLPLGYIQLNSNCPQRQKWREGDFYWVKVGNSCSSPYSDEYIIIYSKHSFFFFFLQEKEDILRHPQVQELIFFGWFLSHWKCFPWWKSWKIQMQH